MKTEIIAVLDHSGSMAGRIEDAIGGFNTLLDEQRKLADPCTMTLVQFDNQYDVVCTDTDLANVPNLTKATFVPRGSTALLDAIGKTIDDAITRYKNIDKPERVLFIIVTDGEENSSSHYNKAQIKEKLEGLRSQGWEFIFVGATEESMNDAVAYGVNSAFTTGYAGEKGYSDAMSRISVSTVQYRSSGKMTLDKTDDPFTENDKS